MNNQTSANTPTQTAKKRVENPSLPYNWQVIISEIKAALASPSMGVVVVVIDQSTVIVDNITTISQHGKGNSNSCYTQVGHGNAIDSSDVHTKVMTKEVSHE